MRRSLQAKHKHGRRGKRILCKVVRVCSDYRWYEGARNISRSCQKQHSLKLYHIEFADAFNEKKIFFMHYCTFGRNNETCFNLCKWKRIFFLSVSISLFFLALNSALNIQAFICSIYGAYPRICLCKFYILALINDGRLLKYIYANGLNLRSYKALVFDTKTHKLYVHIHINWLRCCSLLALSGKRKKNVH